MKQRKFLEAEWRKLLMANYVVDPAVLKGYLPAGTELDLWEGRCYISLVGFLFQNVRVRGITFPFHKNFPEVNLRFYVRFKEGPEWKRGVVFIKEIVPKWPITFIANTLYDEHYATMPMRAVFRNEGNLVTVAYEWKKKNKWNRLEVTADKDPVPIAKGSEEEFITEHFWGYSARGKDKTTEYHVSHPRWDIYPLNSYRIDCDFRSVYGDAFSFLQEEKPVSVFLAEGSEVSVYTKKAL